MSPPDLKVMSWVDLPTEDELELLQKIVEQNNDGSTVLSLLVDQAEFRLQIWRVADGLVLTQTIIPPTGKQLVVYGMAGRGIIRVLDEACADLKVIAKTFECKSIGGNVFRPGLKALYEKLGAKPVFTFYELEL